jgi:hypothetical protein
MLASILLAAVLAQTPAATAAPAPNPAVDSRAKDWFHRLQTGNIDSAQLDDQARRPLNSDVALIISTDWSALGAPLSFDEIRVDEPTDTSPDWTYVYRLTFRNDIAFDFFFGLDPRGLISGMRLGPEEQ